MGVGLQLGRGDQAGGGNVKQEFLLHPAGSSPRLGSNGGGMQAEKSLGGIGGPEAAIAQGGQTLKPRAAAPPKEGRGVDHVEGRLEPL